MGPEEVTDNRSDELLGELLPKEPIPAEDQAISLSEDLFRPDPRELEFLDDKFVGLRRVELLSLGISLEIFDVLRNGELSADELATQTGTDLTMLKTWADYATLCGLLSYHEGCFSADQELLDKLPQYQERLLSLISDGCPTPTSADMQTAQGDDIIGRSYEAFLQTVLLANGIRHGLKDLPPSKLRMEESERQAWCKAALAKGIIEGTEPDYYLPVERRKAILYAGGHANYLVSTLPDWGDYVEVIRTGALIEHLDRNDSYLEELSLASQPTYDYLFGKIFPLKNLETLCQSGARVAEIGFGAGHGLINFNRHYPDAYLCGVDISDQAFGLAAQNLAEAGKTESITLCRREDLASELDLLIICQAFHEIENPVQVLQFYRERLKENGRILIVDPPAPKPCIDEARQEQSINEARPDQIIGSGVAFDERLQGTPFYDPEEVRKLLGDAGFNRVERLHAPEQLPGEPDFPDYPFIYAFVGQ